MRRNWLMRIYKKRLSSLLLLFLGLLALKSNAFPPAAPPWSGPSQPVCSRDFSPLYLGRLQCDGSWYIYKDFSRSGVCSVNFCRIEFQNDSTACATDNDPVTLGCYERMIAAQRSGGQGIKNETIPRTSK